MTWFLDTNICILFLKGSYPYMMEVMRTHRPADVKIPAVVQTELLYGVEKSARREENRQNVERFLSIFEIVPFGKECAGIYGEVRAELERQGSPIGPNDLLIAATVLSCNGILVTKNQREFSRIKGLQLENWVEMDIRGSVD
jgi:tRNA(fMet)-specific endonuclease VapC